MQGQESQADTVSTDSSDTDDGFNPVTKAYKNDPSIENYVKLRRQIPTAEIEVAIFGGIDELCFMEPELEKHGFAPSLIASLMDADPDAISEVSLQLMEKMIAAESLSRKGKTTLRSRGLVVPDKLIDWLIDVMLDATSWNDSLHIPRDLIVLIRERLTRSNSHYRQAFHAHEKRGQATWIAGRMLAMGRRPGFRLLAKILDVYPSTVKRWFPNQEFMKDATRVSRYFDAEGKLRSPPFPDHPVA